MTTLRIALAWVRLVSALLRDRESRVRYREEWECDLRGASALGLHPLSLAMGATVAVCRIALATSKGHLMVPVGPVALVLRLVHGRHGGRQAAVLAVMFGLLLLAGAGMLLLR